MAEAIEELFLVFSRRFAHKWKPTFDDPAARKVWLRDLGTAGVTAAEVRRGVELCAHLEWPPSVGEFLRWCRPTPQMLGLPSLEEAYQEARRNLARAAVGMAPAWSHVAVEQAAAAVPAWRDTISGGWLPDSVTRPQFERSYTIIIRKLTSGEPLKLIPLALPPKVNRASPEVARGYLTKLREELKRGPAL